MIYNKIIHSLLLLFVHFIAFTTVDAQIVTLPIRTDAFEPEVLIDNYTQADGLPIDGITTMEWGNDNWLYVTTFDGIARFNGSNFQVFNSSNDSTFFIDSIVRQLHSKKNGIWLIDNEYELIKWEPKKGIRIGRKEGLPNIMVHNVIEDVDHSIWLGTEYGIFKLDNNGQFKQFNRDLRLVVLEIFPIDQHSAYAITNQGLFMVTEFQLINILPANDPLFVGDVRSRFSKAKDDGVIVSTAHGIVHLDNRSNIIFRKNLGVMVYQANLLQQNEEAYLLRTTNNFFVYSPKTKSVDLFQTPFKLIGGTFKEYDLYWQGELLLIDDNDIFHKGKKIFNTPNNSLINSVIQDKSGNLWVATNGEGLFKIRYSKFQTLDENDGISGLNTYSIREMAGNRIWFTTMGQGLLEWNGKNLLQHNVFPIENRERIDSRTLTITRDNSVFVSFWNGGLWSNSTGIWIQEHPKSHPLISRNNVIDAIYEDNKGRLWLGTISGLYVYDRQTNNYTEIRDSLGFPIPKIRTIKSFDDTHIIAGTNGNGVFKFNLTNNYAYAEPFELTGLSIRDISIHNDTIWYASEDKGLIRVIYHENKKPESARFHYPKIKKDWAVHKILTDRFGFWWLSNNQGLYRIKKSELDLFLDEKISETKLEYFTEKDGLPYRELNGGVQSAGIADGRGNLWFPGIRGLSFLKPANFLKSDSLRPELLLTNYETDLAKYEIFNNILPIRLSKDERTITIHFDVLDFSNPKQFTFSYASDKNPSTWVDLQDKRSFTLSNLESGSHHINIKINHRFSYQPSIIAFDFEVEPHFYETALFYTLTFLGIAGLLSGLLFTLIHRNKNREIRLQLRIDARSKELIRKQEETDSILKIVQQQRDELNQMNKNQIENFHAFSHKIRTPLQMIRGPVELIITTLKENGNLDYRTNQSLQLLEKYNLELINYSDRLLQVITENYQFSRENEESQTSILSDSIELIEATEKEFEKNKVVIDEMDSSLIKLLIIDDIEDIRDYLKLALNNDFNLKTASSGKDAFKILETFKPDVIISDVMMPEMDGFEFAKKLYQTAGFEHIPLIFLTAKDSEEDRFIGLQSGAVAYITKPANISVLKAQVHALVKRELIIRTEKSKKSEKNEASIFQKKINELILRHLSNTDLSLETLADALHMSKSTLYRKWKEESNDTLANHILSLRLSETLHLVQSQTVSFAEASSMCGFNNPSYFSRAFKKVYGCTPSEYLEKTN